MQPIPPSNGMSCLRVLSHPEGGLEKKDEFEFSEEMSFEDVCWQGIAFTNSNIEKYQTEISENEKILLKAIFPTLLAETYSSDAAKLAKSFLKKKDAQILALKAMKIFLNSLVQGFHISEDKEQMRKYILDMIETISDSSLETLLSSTELLPQWVDEIIECQKLFKPFVTFPILNEEGAKGVMYKIQTEGKTLGYLFGTFHYALSLELYKATKLSATVVKRLLKSTILGTEIKLNPNKGSLLSVEDRLLKIARKQGIVNFGIDTEERDGLMGQVLGLSETDNQMSCEEKEVIMQSLDEFAKAYQIGDVEKLSLIANKESDLDWKLAQKRDVCMAQNMDAFLKVAKSKKEPYRSFFAIGTNHLLHHRDGYESTRILLTKLGWQLKLVETADEGSSA